MLTAEELVEVQKLLEFLNTTMHYLQPDDITLIEANGEPCAVIGMGDGGYVLKRVV